MSKGERSHIHKNQKMNQGYNSMSQNKLLLARFIIVFIALQFDASYSDEVRMIPYTCTHQSSCGNITNITYPFRLEGDPSNCGDPNYQLSCENNRTMLLGSDSAKYLVKAINYNNHTIRIVDVGVHDGNCSTKPIDSSFDPFERISYGRHGDICYSNPYFWFYNYELVYVSCETPIKSPEYMDTSPCIKSTTNNRRYQYVTLDITFLELHASCAIDHVASVFMLLSDLPWPRSLRKFSNYMDIYERLVYGAELDWGKIACCRNEGYCRLENNTIIQSCERDRSCTKCDRRCELAYFFSDELPYALHVIRRTIEDKVLVPLLVTFFGVRLLFGIPFVLALVIYKWRRKHLSNDDTLEEFLQSQNNFMPIRYSYSQIKKMSRGFRDKLGEGGYGTVFKGKLASGRLVAIKMLGRSKANAQDFINEVATIGRIHHVNIVSLVGFCSEGHRRALVYDFMPKGSLDKYAPSREGHVSLSWKKMYEISLGVARGIEYLHRGCDMQILHFDIKPHNILLDENFIPKISDFGLAKLYSTDDNIVSVTMAKGTIGYIAPELVFRRIGGVSYKADVYSFGMLLMEMLGKRKKLDTATDNNSSQMYFPLWVYNEMVQGRITEAEDAIGEEEESIIKKMTIVGLWSVQIRPYDRPSMRTAIQMLEGRVENLQLPPEPTFNIEQVPAENAEEVTSPTWSSLTSVGTSESVTLVVDAEWVT